MDEFGKLFVMVGAVLIVIGSLLILASKVDLFGFSLGRLPGDIMIKRDNFVFYFPLGTSIVLSILFSFILFLIFAVVKK